MATGCRARRPVQDEAAGRCWLLVWWGDSGRDVRADPAVPGGWVTAVAMGMGMGRAERDFELKVTVGARFVPQRGSWAVAPQALAWPNILGKN